MEITIRVEWDMGHRLPHHGGQCRNLHGHRYAAEVTLRGPVENGNGNPSEGMVMDFGPVKDAVRRVLLDRDHRFLFSHTDPLLQQVLQLPGVVVVPYIPTAENIAADLLRSLREAVETPRAVSVSRVRLFETPTSWADAS